MLINFSHMQGFRPYFLMSSPFTAIPSICFRGPWLMAFAPIAELSCDSWTKVQTWPEMNLESSFELKFVFTAINGCWNHATFWNTYAYLSEYKYWRGAFYSAIQKFWTILGLIIRPRFKNLYLLPQFCVFWTCHHCDLAHFLRK